MEFLMDLFALIGRVLISTMFLWGAYGKIKHWHQTMSHMHAKGVAQANVILPILIALKVIGGLSVLFGWHAHIGALLLILVTLFALFKFHDFWMKQGNERMMEQAIFMKEVAILGGLFMILSMGAGHFGIGGGG